MRIRIRFRKCALRVDARKTGFKAHSIRFEVASGQASGLQRKHLQFGSPWPGACQTDYALLCVTIVFCDLIGRARILALVQKLYTVVSRLLVPIAI